MNDRELLELAARAFWPEESEVSFRFSEGDDAIVFLDGANQDHNGQDVELVWNPLTDDGDALRLAAGLRIDIVHFIGHVRADMSGMPDTHQMNNGDPYAATRRAIVRAAAEIGKVAK